MVSGRGEERPRRAFDKEAPADGRMPVSGADKPTQVTSKAKDNLLTGTNKETPLCGEFFACLSLVNNEIFIDFICNLC